MKSYHIYFGKIRDFFATSFVPSSERVPWRAESWNTVESQYRYRYLHKSTAEETLIILVSWFRQHEHVKNSTCGRLFIDCLFWQILPSRLSAGPAYMKRLQFVILPYFHLHARYFHKPCGNRHGFTPLLCIVASPRRIETEGEVEGKRGWSKEVEKKRKEKKKRKGKEKKRKEAIKRRKRRRLSTWERRAWSRLWKNYEIYRDSSVNLDVTGVLQRIYCDGSLLFHALWPRTDAGKWRDHYASEILSPLSYPLRV